MSDDKGRNGPDNKCCFRHFCKAESVAYQRVMSRDEILKELLEDIVQAPGRTALLDQLITRASLWLRTGQLIQKTNAASIDPAHKMHYKEALQAIVDKYNSGAISMDLHDIAFLALKGSPEHLDAKRTFE